VKAPDGVGLTQAAIDRSDSDRLGPASVTHPDACNQGLGPVSRLHEPSALGLALLSRNLKDQLVWVMTSQSATANDCSKFVKEGRKA